MDLMPAKPGAARRLVGIGAVGQDGDVARGVLHDGEQHILRGVDGDDFVDLVVRAGIRGRAGRAVVLGTYLLPITQVVERPSLLACGWGWLWSNWLVTG